MWLRSIKWVVSPALCMLAAAALVACGKSPQQEGPPAGKCQHPTDVAVTNDQLKIASGQIGKASVGGLELKVDTEVVKLLGEGDRSALVVDYLLCEARERGELKDGDTVRLDYVREMLLFVVSARPTADQLAAWQREHHPPQAPTGKLELPDFQERGGRTVFELQAASPVKTFRLLNVGKAPLHAWLAQYRQEQLLFSPSAGQFTLNPGEGAMTIELGLLLGAQFDAPMLFQVASDAGEARQIEVNVLNPQALRAQFEQLANGTAKRVVRSVRTESIRGQLDQAPKESRRLIAAGVIEKAAEQEIREALPGAQNRTVLALSGSLLEGMNWPMSAAIAYRQARAANPAAAASLDAPLARALFLANAPPDASTHEKNLSDTFDAHPEHVTGESTWKLKLAGNNPLVTPANQAVAEQAVTALESSPHFTSFARSLRGDLDLSEGYASQAVDVYDRCWTATNSPSCVLRKSEAQVAAKRPNDALKSLAEMTKGGAANSAADRVREVAIAAVAGADTTT